MLHGLTIIDDLRQLVVDEAPPPLLFTTALSLLHSTKETP